MDDGLVHKMLNGETYGTSVLILVVVDDGLVHAAPVVELGDNRRVLILVVVDDGLVHAQH